MRAYVVPKGCKSIEEVRPGIERSEPQPAAGQVLVRVRAASLNYRDQAIAAGMYFTGPVSADTIPLSDGAGEVVAVGPGVARYKPGDRVAGTFFQPSDLPMPATLGVPLDGMLTELAVLPQDGSFRSLRRSPTRRQRVCRAQASPRGTR